MSDVRALFRIQELELDIIERTKRIKSIDARLEDDAAVQAAQAQADEAREAHELVAKQVTELETEIAAVTEKRAESEAALYSGEERNPKTLHEMQMEVEALARRKSVLEDELARVAAEGQALLDASDECEDSLKTLKAERKVENADLVGERDALKASVSELLSVRKDDIKEVSADLFKRYNRMRVAMSNRPMAELRDNACTICGIEQNSTVIAAIYRTDDIVTCQNCGRILIRL